MPAVNAQCVWVFNMEAVPLSPHLCFGALLCSANSGKCLSIERRSEKPVHSATGAAVLQFLAFSSVQPGCLLHFQKYSLVTWCQKFFLWCYSCVLLPKIAHSSPVEVYITCGTRYPKHRHTQSVRLDQSHHNVKKKPCPGEELSFKLRFVPKVSCCYDRQARVKTLVSIEACSAYNQSGWKVTFSPQMKTVVATATQHPAASPKAANSVGTGDCGIGPFVAVASGSCFLLQGGFSFRTGGGLVFPIICTPQISKRFRGWIVSQSHMFEVCPLLPVLDLNSKWTALI